MFNVKNDHKYCHTPSKDVPDQGMNHRFSEDNTHLSLSPLTTEPQVVDDDLAEGVNGSRSCSLEKHDITYDGYSRSVSRPARQLPTAIGEMESLLAGEDIATFNSLDTPVAAIELPFATKAEQNAETKATDNGISVLKKTERPMKPGLKRFGWWWECSSMVLSICSTIFIILILAIMDGKPLSAWKLLIQPNSLVAVFSTIAKSSLLYPLAECLGQLKWHYAEDTISLIRIENIDRASRGPWGSTQLLYYCFYKMNRVSLAVFGAVLTALALGAEPFTQQAIGVINRTAPLSEYQGYVPKTDAFLKMSKEMKKDHHCILSVSAQVQDPLEPLANAKCPTFDCDFPDFTSLAACTVCEPPETVFIRDFYCVGEINFQREDLSLRDQNISNFDEFQLSLVSGVTEHLSSWELYCVKNMDNFPLLDLHTQASFKDETDFKGQNESLGTLGLRFGSISHLFTDTVHATQEFLAEFDNPHYVRDPASTSDSLRICVNYHDNQYQFDKLMGDQYWDSTNDLKFSLLSNSTHLDAFTCFESTTDISLWSDLDKTGEINGTITRCSIDLCARTYKNATIRNGGMQVTAIDDISLKAVEVIEGDSSSILVFESGRTDSPSKRQYHVGEVDKDTLREVLGTTTSESPYWLMDSMVYLNDTKADFQGLFNGVADAISAVIQRPDNPQSSRVFGTALASQTFVEARWAWLALPLILTVGTTYLLVVTILQSRRRHYLFKTSLLPTVFLGSGVEGVMRTYDGKITYDRLRNAAKTIDVHLDENSSGELELKKLKLE